MPAATTHVFFNPAAAQGRSGMRLGAALATFRTLGAHTQLHRPDSAADAQAKMAELAGQVERIIVLGGDGMTHLAANALVGTSTILGIVSAGTGNDAVLSFGLSNELEDACKAALRPAQAVDVIESEAGVAVTVATAGFSVDVTDRANDMTLIKGANRYTAASLLQLRNLRSYELTMTLDGVEHEIDANLIAIANTKYFGGGMKVAPDAVLNNGKLDVVVIGPASRAKFAAVLPLVFSGRHVRSKDVAVHRASTIELSGARIDVRADGEEYGSLPATFTVRPKSLLVAGVTV